MFKKSKAFTLAEALIVIAVIGIITAVAFPIFKKIYNEKAMHAALKKNYYILASVIDRYAVDNYNPIKSGDNEIREKIAPYLNVHKVCAATGDEGKDGCPNATEYYEKDNTTTPYTEKWKGMYKYGSLILNDGTLIMIGTSCRTDAAWARYTHFYVDVNGFDKGPNRMSDDLFVLQISADGQLLPMGAPNTDFGTAFCEHDWWNDLYGIGCAYKIISQER